MDKKPSRKDMPVFSGVLKYFPLAILEISKVSKAGNEQHNPGMPMFWDRSKSTDEADALTRHLIQSGTIDEDGIRHTAKVAWRALALLQKELEDAEEFKQQYVDFLQAIDDHNDKQVRTAKKKTK